MEAKSTLNGHDLKEMIASGAAWLEKIVPDINALNVYPVPDGDTGTNMLLTLQASLDAVDKHADGSAAAVARSIARGALMGARGNSGVILSQILQGLAQGFAEKDIINAGNLAEALQSATDTAYIALSNPVEGTILTVIRESAAAATREMTQPEANLASVMTAAVNAARESVINTPNLLSVLKDAGVVDAGGHGLFTFMEGTLDYINNKTDNHLPELLCDQRPLLSREKGYSHEDDFYGFCTQFIISGQNLDAVKIRDKLEDYGESLMVVGDAGMVRVHIHTHDSAAVIQTASAWGQIMDTDIRNMDEQHQDFLLMKRTKTSTLDTAVIAVVNGPGLVNVFADLGAAAIVSGGKTMNPSTMDILRTVEKVDANNIIILPNNKNVIPTAMLVQSLTKKNLRVIPTKSIPQGISSMVEYIPEADFETNAKLMEANIATVKTIEITQAISSAKVNGLDIKPGQFLGLLDGELLAASNTADEAIFKLSGIIDWTHSSLVTLYYGKETSEASAEQIKAQISERYPQLAVGAVNGGQPNYHYIISVE